MSVSLQDIDPCLCGLVEPEGRLGVGHLAPSVMTAGHGLGTWPWGYHQLRCASSARTWTSEGPSGPWPSCQTGNNICLVEIYRNIIPWPWLNLQNKGSDTKKFATVNHTPLSPFLEKGFAESFWATTHLLAGPYNIPFSVPNSEVLVMFGLTMWRAHDLSFGITSTFIWLTFVKKVCPVYPLTTPWTHVFLFTNQLQSLSFLIFKLY